jgi:uncharacterized protein
MKVRSITSFYDPSQPDVPDTLKKLRRLTDQIKLEISAILMPVQSTRLATTPFAGYLPSQEENRAIEVTQEMEKMTTQMGWDYLSLGPANPNDLKTYALIPNLLAATQHVFLSALISDRQFLYPAAIRASADIISQAATLESNGFTNLRFAALANVEPFAPFLPAAFHKPNDPPAISFAMECADIVLTAFQSGEPLEVVRGKIIADLHGTAIEITSIFNQLSKGAGIQLRGFDFSPAPYPKDACSLGAAVEAVGIEHIGGSGALAAAAIIADTLGRGEWQKAGFNGLMLPLLEDSRLSSRSIEGHLTVQDLLLYSTLCGTGLDTIPLAGDTTTEALTSVLMDVATLATRLGKPLTARLMPIPGKKAGDLTDFDFEFFSQARVLSIKGQSLNEYRFGEDKISMHPRDHFRN